MNQHRALLAAATAICVVCASVPAWAQGCELKIGSMGPMSGGAAQWGLAMDAAANLAAAEANAEGGLKVGDKKCHVTVVAYDSKYTADGAAAGANALTAEGIRTALYFGLACGRELRAVVDGRRTREQALARYGAFSDSHERKYRWLLNVQRAVGQITPSRAMTAIVRAFESRHLTSWVFGHYLAIAPPSFVGTGPASASPSSRLAVATAR